MGAVALVGIKVFFVFVDIKYIFMVGGFSESPLLQEEMRAEFGHLVKIVVPQQSSLAVLKGMRRHF